MALKAGRVGVASSEVDEFGHVTGGGTPENVYTKTQCDNKFETKTRASNTYETKENIGGLKFRDNDGTAQYQLPNGEWTNFNSGGGETLGFNIPANKLITTGITVSDNRLLIESGGYCVEDGKCYVDLTIKPTSQSISSGGIISIPVHCSYDFSIPPSEGVTMLFSDCDSIIRDSRPESIYVGGYYNDSTLLVAYDGFSSNAVNKNIRIYGEFDVI